MTTLELLYNEALENDISVFDYPITKKAACLHNDGFKYIALNKSKIESSAEEKTLLAEELGHFATGSLYFVEATCNTPLAKLNREKCEAKAKRYAINKTISPKKIQEAINSGCVNEYEVAEFCEVPIDFLRDTFEYYKRKGISFERHSRQ